MGNLDDSKETYEQIFVGIIGRFFTRFLGRFFERFYGRFFGIILKIKKKSICRIFWKILEKILRWFVWILFDFFKYYFQDSRILAFSEDLSSDIWLILLKNL